MGLGPGVRGWCRENERRAHIGARARDGPLELCGYEQIYARQYRIVLQENGNQEFKTLSLLP
jgi:hypothetical protein